MKESFGGYMLRVHFISFTFYVLMMGIFITSIINSKLGDYRDTILMFMYVQSLPMLSLELFPISFNKLLSLVHFTPPALYLDEKYLSSLAQLEFVCNHILWHSSHSNLLLPFNLNITSCLHLLFLFILPSLLQLHNSLTFHALHKHIYSSLYNLAQF